MNKKANSRIWLLLLLLMALISLILLAVQPNQTREYLNISCEQSRESLLLGIGLKQSEVIVHNSLWKFKWDVKNTLTNKRLKEYYQEECMK